MSERKLRKWLDNMWSLVDESGECRCTGFGYHKNDCEIGQALSEPPDVVVLLRWLKTKLNSAAYMRDWHSFDKVIARIEKTVCLTDEGGWQYIEDE